VTPDAIIWCEILLLVSVFKPKEQKKSFLSAQSAGIGGQLDDDVNSLRLDISQLRCWEEPSLLLKQLDKRKRHCNVPLLHKEDRVEIGQWVNDQHQLKIKDELDSERQKGMAERGFEWEFASATWAEMHASLQRFKRCKGHSIVSTFHKEN
jgi:hypothetical protein